MVHGRGATRRLWPHARPACACVQGRPPRSLSVGRRRSRRACRAWVPHRAGWIGPPTLEGRRASDKTLSFGARPWCHTPVLASRAVGLRMCARHHTHSLWGGGAVGALATRAGHAARVGFDPPTLEGRRASDRAFPFSARPWLNALALDLRAAGLRMCAREWPPHALSVGRRRSTRACRARVPHCAGWIDPTTLEDRGSDRTLSFGARPWCHAPALASRGRFAHVRKKAATARTLCGEEAQ